MSNCEEHDDLEDCGWCEANAMYDQWKRASTEHRAAFIAGWSAHIKGPRGNPIDEVAGAAYEQWKSSVSDTRKTKPIAELLGYKEALDRVHSDDDSRSDIENKRSGTENDVDDRQDHSWVNQGICCREHATPEQLATTMIVCPECGDKRCPRATDCSNTCADSADERQKCAHKDITLRCDLDEYECLDCGVILYDGPTADPGRDSQKS